MQGPIRKKGGKEDAAKKFTKADASKEDLSKARRHGAVKVKRKGEMDLFETDNAWHVPELKIGVALKIADGATRGSEAAIAHILGQLGVLDPHHPEALAFTNGPIRNWNGIETGHYQIADALSGLQL